MIEENQIIQLKKGLQRVFAFPISYTTFKEMQTTVFSLVNQSEEKANEVLHALLSGEIKKSEGESKNTLSTLVDEFGIPARLSRDVLEKGEFINFMSSDLLRQGDRALFTNHVRRVDGACFRFFSEPEGILRLLEHFTGRLEELNRGDKNKVFLKGYKEELRRLKERIEALNS